MSIHVDNCVDLIKNMYEKKITQLQNLIKKQEVIYEYKIQSLQDKIESHNNQ